MDLKTVNIFGASGLVGSHLLQELIAARNIGIINIFVRKPMEVTSEKVNQVISDLHNPLQIADSLSGEAVFCCLGTTIKKAGSKENFEKVDYELPVKIAAICQRNGIQTFVVVSSIGASQSASNFYLHVKGKMEEALTKSGFTNLIIIRPSLLLGERGERRLLESLFQKLMRATNSIMLGSLKKYAAVNASDVARCMYQSLQLRGKHIIESDQIALHL